MTLSALERVQTAKKAQSRYAEMSRPLQKGLKPNARDGHPGNAKQCGPKTRDFPFCCLEKKILIHTYIGFFLLAKE